MKNFLNGFLFLSLSFFAYPSYSSVLGLNMGDEPGKSCNLESKNECDIKHRKNDFFASQIGVYGVDTGLCAVHLESKVIPGIEKAANYKALYDGLKKKYSRPNKDISKDSYDYSIGDSSWNIVPTKEENIRKIKLSVAPYSDEDGVVTMSIYFENSKDLSASKVSCFNVD